MTVIHTHPRRARLLLRSALFASLAAVGSAPALAYVGDSFISIPDQPGHWKGKEHKGWMRVEASEWQNPGQNGGGRRGGGRLISGPGDALAGDRLWFGGPNATKPGNGGKVVVTMSKANPDLPKLMALCKSKAELPALNYAEDSQLARPGLEVGDRPTEFPAFWEYQLKNVSVEACPVLDGAEAQGLVIAFKDIAWLNYDPAKPYANKVVVKPEALPRVEAAVATPSKKVKSYLVTWIAQAATTTDDQCPKMNAKPDEAAVLRYMTPEQIAEIKAKTNGKGLTAGPETERRGPGGLNAVALPFIIPDPGLYEPQTNVAMGVDLDGDDGKGAPPKGIRKHKNYVAPDGRTGIDNQLFTVMGCIAGMRGKRGYWNQTPNARRADGNITTIIQISDIDDEKNDDHVEISVIHSMDKPIRDTNGKTFIANYTFRPTTNPNHALYNGEYTGKIVNGAVVSDRIPLFIHNPGQGGLTWFHNAQLRFDPQPDGSVKGLIAGYVDWRIFGGIFGSGYSEGLFGYDGAAGYYALKRNADGLKDPVTGEYNGVSAAYEIDTVPAFMTSGTPDPNATQVAGASEGRKSR